MEIHSATITRIWIACMLLLTACALAGNSSLIFLAMIVMLGVAIYRRIWNLLPASLLLVFFYGGLPRLFRIPSGVPVVYFLLPVLVTLLVFLPFPKGRAEFRWLRRGDIDFTSWLLVAATSLLAGAALMAWAAWTDNLGAGAGMVRELVGIPRWFLFLVGVPAFAVLNAFAEEAFYRGFLQEALEQRLPGRTYWILGLQASAFAAAHYAGGFPNGKIGYLMTFIYALMLGHLRMRTKGLLAPFVTHVVADIVIGYTLILLAA